VRKKQELHRVCEANRAYAHFRWWLMLRCGTLMHSLQDVIPMWQGSVAISCMCSCC